jgi:hypothetical protein
VPAQHPPRRPRPARRGAGPRSCSFRSHRRHGPLAAIRHRTPPRRGAEPPMGSRAARRRQDGMGSPGTSSGLTELVPSLLVGLLAPQDAGQNGVRGGDTRPPRSQQGGGRDAPSAGARLVVAGLLRGRDLDCRGGRSWGEGAVQARAERGRSDVARALTADGRRRSCRPDDRAGAAGRHDRAPGRDRWSPSGSTRCTSTNEIKRAGKDSPVWR